MVKAVELSNVSFIYKGRTNAALSNINIYFPKCKVTLITGNSGSGKTSLIRVINGLIPHFYTGKFNGNIYFFDEDITSLTASERFKLGLSTVMQFPEDQLLSRKVWRSVAFGLANLGYPRELILKRVKWALKLVEMEYYFDKEINSLSTGQKQKIALASALAIEPQLLLLDEPTSQLDPLSSKKFLEVLRNVTKDLDLTVIMSEHRIDELYEYVDDVIVLNNGVIVAHGSAWEVFNGNEVKKLGVKIPTIINLARLLRLDEEAVGKEKVIQVLRDRIKEKESMNHRESTRKVESKPVLIIRNLYFKYGNRKWVLENINLSILKSEFIVIMGHNGSGKTTLAKLMIGLLKPNRGQIYYPERKISNPESRKLVGYVAYAPQNPGDLIFNQTVYDEIAFSLKLRKVNGERIDSIVYEIARKFNLEDILYKSPYSISGGEKLRTIIASIYALDPAIYILDEPTRGLDWKFKIELINLLSKIRKEGKSIVLITHDIELVSHADIDRIIVLNNGRIWIEGEKKAVLTSNKILEAKLIKPTICDIFSTIGYKDILEIQEALNLIK